MQKVITINLNGNAYQLEETGYDALRAYLSAAAGQLLTNPDKAEITADLEQAIADKCLRSLGTGKTVVVAAELEQILKEIGPVDGGHSAADVAQAAKDVAKDSAPRRLYRMREGAMMGGVCSGIAAYLSVDPTIVRIIFVVLTYFKGIGAGIYLLLMILLPYATSKEFASARGPGLPDRVQNLIEKVKRVFGAK